MVFMRRLQCNAPVSAVAMVRKPSNLILAPAFQPMTIAASYAACATSRDVLVYDVVHNLGAFLGNVPYDPCKGSFTLIQETPELALSGARIALKNRTAAAGGQTEISDGCGRLSLRATETIVPCSSGPCRPAPRIAVCLPGGRRDRLNDHDCNQAV